MGNSFTEKARWDAFMALDRMRGGGIHKKMEEDLAAFRHGTSEERTEEKIDALLRHAAATTAFYRHMSPDAALRDFPVVNKDTFRENYEAMQSSAWKGCPKNRVMSTSGSTGTPLQMIQDPGKIESNTADSIFLSSVGGYRIGEKMAFIRVWVRNVRKSAIQLFAENSIMMDSSSLSDESIAAMLRTIRRRRVRVLIGYSSALGEISSFIARHDMSLNGYHVHAIIPISESMPDPVRRQLERQFGCPVRAWYSNEENGVIGLEMPHSDAYYINSESYYIEILKMDSDEPAEDGEVGRIVITDLTNYAFPIIRYDNGDTAAAKHVRKNGRFKLILTELYGRRSDMLYDTQGRAVTPYVITNNLWNISGVRQYQFVQTGIKEYTMKLNAADPGKVDEAEILRRIKPSFGEDATISFTYVDEIPTLASGKVKYIENRCPAYAGR